MKKTLLTILALTASLYLIPVDAQQKVTTTIYQGISGTLLLANGNADQFTTDTDGKFVIKSGSLQTNNVFANATIAGTLTVNQTVTTANGNNLIVNPPADGYIYVPADGGLNTPIIQSDYVSLGEGYSSAAAILGFNLYVKASDTTNTSSVRILNTGSAGYNAFMQNAGDFYFYGTNGAVTANQLFDTSNLNRLAVIDRSGVFTTGLNGELGGVVTSNVTARGGITVGDSGTKFISSLMTNIALDFPSIEANSETNLTITLPGAGTNATIAFNPPEALTAGIGVTAYVSATNTVTIRAINPTGAAIDPASGAYRVRLFVD